MLLPTVKSTLKGYPSSFTMPQQSRLQSFGCVFIALTALAPSVSGHCLFSSATGDWTYSNGNQGWTGWTRGLGFRDEVESMGRKHGYQFPNQWDVPIFATSAMEWTKPICTNGEGGKCCAKDTCWPSVYYNTPTVKRSYVTSGCGITIHNIIQKYEGRADYSGESQDQSWTRQVKYYQQWAPSEAYVDVNWEIWQQVQKKQLTHATAGGYIMMNLHQVNDDGAGPFKCKLDMTGTGKRGDHGWDSDQFPKSDSDWDGWLPVNQTGVLQEDPQYFADRGRGLSYIPGPRNYIMSVQLPNNLDCKGELKASDGTVVQSDLCLIRCENPARNGPFGGCIYFQQHRLPKKQPKPYKKKPLPKPPKPTKVPVPKGYDANKLEPVQAEEDPQGYENAKRNVENKRGAKPDDGQKLRFKRQ